MTARDAENAAVELEPTSLPALVVVFHKEPQLIGQRVVFDSDTTLVLGRGSHHIDDAVFDHGSVSRRHCEIAVRGSSVHLTDLGSRNGTRVNGAFVTSVALVTGDVVGIGDVLLLFHQASRTMVTRSKVGMIVQSAAMQEVLASVRRLAPSDRTILVRGPTGSGKELVAREIHAASGRKGEFVAVNCGAIADALVMSELFGHARGSFSGATADRPGLVERARAGTLFLDEIGDASSALQVSLLRLLEQREYRRVGDDTVRSTDTRFVTATHVALEEHVPSGRFRADLLGRIAGFSITIPALCWRPDDIIPMALSFAEARAGKPCRLSARLTSALLRYPWPLNVRELAAVVEEAQLAHEPGAPLDLTPALSQRLSVVLPDPPVSTRDPGRHVVQSHEPVLSRSGKASLVARPTADALRDALSRAGGNMRRLASELGVARSTLYRWFDELKIDNVSSGDIAPRKRL